MTPLVCVRVCVCVCVCVCVRAVNAFTTVTCPVQIPEMCYGQKQARNIYIYAVESKLGPKIAFFESKLGPSLDQVLTQPWTKF